MSLPELMGRASSSQVRLEQLLSSAGCTAKDQKFAAAGGMMISFSKLMNYSIFRSFAKEFH